MLPAGHSSNGSGGGIGGSIGDLVKDVIDQESKNRQGRTFNPGAKLDAGQVRDARGIGGSTNAWVDAQKYAKEKQRLAALARAAEQRERSRLASIERLEEMRKNTMLAPGEDYQDMLDRRKGAGSNKLGEEQREFIEDYGGYLDDAKNTSRASRAGMRRLEGERKATPGLGAALAGRAEFRKSREKTNKARADKAGTNRLEGVRMHEFLTNLDPALKKYLEIVDAWQNDDEDSPLSDSPAGTGSLEDGYFADMAAGATRGMPQLSDDAPNALLDIDPKTGKVEVQTMQKIFMSVMDRVNDTSEKSTAEAGELAYVLSQAGYYSEASKKRLFGDDKDPGGRLKAYTDANGRGRFRMVWGDEDNAALKAALTDAAKIGATDAGNSLSSGTYKFRDWEEIIASKAGLNMQLEQGVAMQGGGMPRDSKTLATLAPGNYGGVDLNQEQLQNAATIAQVGEQMNASPRDIGIALITAMTESRLKNVNHGDRDSLGLFQQRPSQGWGSPAQVQDPVYSSKKFYEHLLKIGGRESVSMGALAQKVQRSAFPERYAKSIPMATEILGAKSLGAGAELKMLGNVKPHVKSAAKEISTIWGFDNIGGLAKSGHIPGSDHYTGKAIDVMLTKGHNGHGPEVVDYAMRNAKRLGVKDIIHNNTYYSVQGGKWESEPYTGANPHTGHVHVGFHNSAGSGGGGLVDEIAGGTPSGGYGGGSGSAPSSGGGGGAGYQGGYGAAAVSYSDASQIGELADNVAQEELGRNFDEDEIADLVSEFHSREASYQNDSAAGLSSTQPDLQGAVRAFIKKKLQEEHEMQKGGQLAMAAFQLLSGGPGGMGMG